MPNFAIRGDSRMVHKPVSLIKRSFNGGLKNGLYGLLAVMSLTLIGCKTKDQEFMYNDQNDFVVKRSGCFSKWVFDTVLAQINPKNFGYSGCANCGRKWAIVPEHTIEINENQGMFPLCNNCFFKLRMKDVKFYIEKQLKRNGEIQYLDQVVFNACKDKYDYIKAMDENRMGLIPYSLEGNEAMEVCSEAKRNLMGKEK